MGKPREPRLQVTAVGLGKGWSQGTLSDNLCSQERRKQSKLFVAVASFPKAAYDPGTYTGCQPACCRPTGPWARRAHASAPLQDASLSGHRVLETAPGQVSPHVLLGDRSAKHPLAVKKQCPLRTGESEVRAGKTLLGCPGSCPVTVHTDPETSTMGSSFVSQTMSL